MKNYFFIPLILLLSSCAVPNPNKNVLYFRYYLLSTSFRYDDDFYIEMRASGRDNNFLNYHSYKNDVTIPIKDKTSNYYLCYFDIPTNVESAIFYSMRENSTIGDYGHSAYFEIKYKNFLLFQNRGYFFPDAKNVESFYTSSNFFVSCIFASLDANSDSFCDGYNAVDSLKTLFYEPIIMEEGKDAFANYSWFDFSLDRVVTFDEKWNIVNHRQTEYALKHKNDNVLSIIIVVAGSSLFLIAVIWMILQYVYKRKK